MTQMIKDYTTQVNNDSWVLQESFLNYETLLMLLAMCEKNVLRYLVLVISAIPGISIISGWIIPCLYILLITLILKKRGFKVPRGGGEILPFLFVLFAIFVTVVVYPQNAEYIFDSNNFWNTIFPCVRFFIVGLIFIPDRNRMNLLGKASCVAIIIETAFVVVYMIPRGLLTNDEMSRAYQLLPNVMFAINYAFNEKTVKAWLCSVIGITYTFAMGTRGPIIILLSYMLLKFFKNTQTRLYTKAILISCFAGICALFLNSNLYNALIQSLIHLFGSVGLSTRVLDLALQGTVISHMAGRDELYELALSKIDERPLLGYGVYGEWPWAGWSIHNMYLEFLIHYGIIIGSILIMWLVITVLRSYIKTRNDESRDVILIWACFVFVRGLFGGSYLMFGVFFLVAFCLRELSRIRERHFQYEE